MTTIVAFRLAFGGHGNRCPGRVRLIHRGDHPSASPGSCRIRPNAGVVAMGDVCGGAQNSSGFARIGAIYMQATPALLTLGALARAMQLVDAGIGLFQRDLRKSAGPLVLAVLQSSWFICFTYPCGLRHKPSADKGTCRLAPETFGAVSPKHSATLASSDAFE
jgi:hypothetical protein